MRQFTVPLRFDNQRIDAFLFDRLPGVPASVLYKAFRKRSVKVDGQRVKESFRLILGQQVELYIPEEYLNGSEKGEPDGKSALVPIVYEDDYLLVVSKPQGMPVHQDQNDETLVLDSYLHNYLRQRDGIPYEEGFPALCHRIDRNTGGLVVLAKDPQTLKVMLDKFRLHEIRKVYTCLVNGIPEKSSSELTGYLKKDSLKSRVTIFDHPVKGSEPIVTRYRELKKLEGFSLLEVELITGKTHQIRAHLAYIGHPLVGDGKYGINKVNQSLKVKWQALWAKKVTFDFSSSSGHMDYLKGKTVTLPSIPWEEGLQSFDLNGVI